MNRTIPFVFLILLFGVAGWYFFIREPDPAHELPPTLLPSPEIAEVQEPEPRTEEGEEEAEPEAIPLPLLQEETDTDTTTRKALAEIIGAEPLAEYLVKDQVISRLVATVDSLSSRQVAPEINPIKPVAGKFATDNEGERILMSEGNFARYDGYVELLQVAETGALVSFYKAHYPWFQEAWEENGGEGSFNDRLRSVIDHLLETPDVPGPVYLNKPEAVYLFEDPALEAMTAGQKILVRMGSVNAALVKEKLLEISTRLNTLEVIEP